MASKSQPKKSLPKSRTWLRKTVIFLSKILIVVVVLTAAYAIYLDSKIDQKFSTDHWQIPAKVYAQSLTLKPKQRIARNQVINELEALNYRRVSTPNAPGEYSISKTKIDINRRAFSYIDTTYPQQRVMMKFNGNYLKSMTDLKTRQSLAQFNIEPKLLKRISNSSKEDRIFIPREQIPELLVATLLHIEDRNFYQHQGIAPLSILRALVANIKAGRTVQGGSTLTQQLVKNVFLTRERSVLRKAKEALYSLLIELKYSKDELLEIYLNEVFLGQNGPLSVNGFGLASEFYFARPIDELMPEQVALLVAIIKGPSYYSPSRYPERALERRDFILRQMVNQDFISAQQYQRAAKSPLGLKSSVAKHGQFHGFMSLVKRELGTRFTQDFSNTSGISIYTTLDSNAQRFAQKSLTNRIKTLEKSSKTNKLQGAVVVANYRSGQIKAIVEGKDANYAGFNRALNAQRPIGSLIKPFIVASALEDMGQYNLATMLDDQAISLTNNEGEVWQPLNYDKKFRGQANILDSLTYSYNIPMVNLGMDVGLDTISYGLERAGWQGDFKRRPSMLLGAIEASPWMVTQLYQSLANNGEQRKLHAVLAVTTKNEETFYAYENLPVQAITPQMSYLTRYALNKVTSKGTAKSLRWKNKGLALAGKTGTTDDLRDSWYAGFDNNEATVVWLGRDDNKSIGLTGSTGALTVYSDFVKQRGGVSLPLGNPASVVTGYFDATSGLASAKGCPNALAIPAIEASVQEGSCQGTSKTTQKKEKKQSVFDDFLGLF
ncbi:penicillin-binding protein 1B [Psychrobium sp. nBUS_13]|uniref:penicillin-binding protein 1B n=1 Tax=Psychrobium sp. nBUS_13 TaxID=3395319 RepID=UPI003EC053D6